MSSTVEMTWVWLLADHPTDAERYSE
jgi:hypothetical protein